MKRPDDLRDAISRLETQIELKRKSGNGEAVLFMVSIRDVERLIHAAIWGED